jgi:hypothetical protein
MAEVVFGVDVAAEGGDGEDGKGSWCGQPHEGEVELERGGQLKSLGEGENCLCTLFEDVLRLLGFR